MHYSTEEPDTSCKSVRNDGVETSHLPPAQNISEISLASSTAVSGSDGLVDQRRGLEVTLSVSRRPSSSSTPSNRVQPRRHYPQTNEKRQDYKALRQDYKALRMLSAILLAFVVTWSPYNLFTVVRAFCTGTRCINDILYAAGTTTLCTSFTA